MDPKSKSVDSYVWGEEEILYGFDPSHEYTYKLLKPKKGRQGCLSLQYHRKKSETWLVARGIAWGITIIDDKVETHVLHPGDHLNLEAGTIHRLMAVTDDCIVAESSTPDAYAADKNVEKDVIRLHCVHGRDCVLPDEVFKSKLVLSAIHATEAAIADIEAGKIPESCSCSGVCDPKNYTI